MSLSSNLGVQSYCFRNFKDNVEVAAKVKEIGLDRIEICRLHAGGDFHNLENWKEVVKTYTDAGVKIVSVGVETLVGDPSERDAFEAVAMAGAKHISVHFKVDSFGKAIAQARSFAREYGIKVGIHCHGGYMFGGQPDVMEHLINLGTPEVGLCIDTAWCMQIGPKQGVPLEWIKKYSGKVHGIHFKDFVFEKNAGWKDTVVGQGNLDLPAFAAQLKADNYDGMAVIEYEADPENPVPALKNCVEQMRNVL
ncbi:sugar phosphate isomerase/epimerase [Ruficoccus sp. ZRK36]|uniref:sugar phosphate isomerase/epimerase family protein n=1 Tax=Ruficoccus sp. ZRK36 TaxID=2866311 RepID=UPI001C734D00|nr:sugar phosphate isomerase/epimerase [Ruficoccus sp. ZRK36]QYY36581.1 sugar phosphate isomerase/epimerase [Ruficoccus sp. ZRK36]